MELDSIKSSVQEVAEAIAAVLHVDVTIIDRNFKRIASTGNYKARIGDRLPSKCLYENVIKEKHLQYADRGHKGIDEEPACRECEARDTCKEMATIGYPIMDEGEILGIIGVNAFDEKSAYNISCDFDSMVRFLERLSSLLVGNIHYRETIMALQIHKQETNHIMDGLSNGVVCVDNDGIIKYINEKGRRLLDIDSGFEKINIFNVLNDINKEELFGRVKLSSREAHTNKNKKLILKSKPIEVDGHKVSTLIQLTQKSDEMRAAYNLFVNSREVTFDDIIGKSEAINSVKKLAKGIARTNATVLIQGESGTGKELFARAIHSGSPRRNKPFIAVNCASIPDNLLESEFFGYEGGTFTGAKRQGHTGKFELASGGTLFLDEIGDLPLHLQPKILRVLQEHSFTKIGGKEEIRVDVRIIAATNRNLKVMVENGEFRKDLYYRLNVIPIILPSLAKRGDDILLLSSCLIKKYCIKYGIEEKFLSKEVEGIFKTYRWPGNIREMENAIEYAVNVSSGNMIDKECLPQAIKNNEGAICINGLSLKDRVSHYEKEVLKSLLESYGSDADGKNRICEELKIDLSTLYRKMNKYDLQ